MDEKIDMVIKNMDVNPLTLIVSVIVLAIGVVLLDRFVDKWIIPSIKERENPESEQNKDIESLS